MEADSESPEALNSGFKLEKLPRELLEVVLSFDGMTLPAIRLFTSGSVVMRRNVCLSATVMHLESFKVPNFTLLPSILPSLSYLRALTIDCYGESLIGARIVIDLLKRISPTLEKLILRVHHAIDICEPNPDFRHWDWSYDPNLKRDNAALQAADAYVDLTTCFPRLKWLELGGGPLFLSPAPQALPPTLTHLTCYFGSSGPISQAIALPPSLTYLKAKAWHDKIPPPSFWNTLPATLEHLDIENADLMQLKHFEALPRSLKSLKLNNIWLTSDLIKALPPHLESIDSVCNHDLQFLDGLPTWPTLTRLNLNTHQSKPFFPAQLRQMSRSLTSLDLSLQNVEDMIAGDFPPLLTHLNLKAETSFEHLGPLLLSTPLLRTLVADIPTVSTKLINQLPPYLTELKVCSSKVDGTNPPAVLPPSLVFLGVTAPYDALMNFASFPATLTSADLCGISIPTLYLLPSRLHSLSFTCRDFTQFDRNSTATLDRVAYLRKEALADGFISQRDLESLGSRSVAVFDLLPRTLTKLTVLGQLEPIEAPDWQSLPNKLSDLRIESHTIKLSKDSLNYIPYESVVTSLHMEHLTFEGEHIKRLNRNLKRLRVAELRPTTLEDVMWIPRGIRFSFRDSTVAGTTELIERRHKARKTLDRKAFFETYCPPNQ